MAAEGRDAEGKPPFFATWRGAYVFVLAWLVVTVVALTWLSRASP